MSTQLPTANWKELLLWLLRRRKRFAVENQSMEPTLYAGDLVFVDTGSYRSAAPQDSDIVVAYHPQQPELRIIKRIQFLDDAGRCYLVSDNATHPDSRDSGSFGFVDPQNVIGRVTSCVHA